MAEHDLPQFLTAMREAIEESKRLPPGTAVRLPPEVAAEMKAFMRGEPSLIDRLAFGDIKALGDLGAESPAAASTAGAAEKAKPVAWRVRGYSQFKKFGPGPWRYFDGSEQPEVNNPECCDFEALYAAMAETPSAAAAGGEEKA